MASQVTLTRRWIMSAYKKGKGTQEISAIFGRCESAVRRFARIIASVEPPIRFCICAAPKASSPKNCGNGYAGLWLIIRMPRWLKSKSSWS